MMKFFSPAASGGDHEEDQEIGPSGEGSGHWGREEINLTDWILN